VKTVKTTPATPEAITHAAAIIRSGGLVAFPTETVYGLGANALDPIAVARIFEAKNRPFFDPLIVHVANVGALDELVMGVDARAVALAAAFWPGPLTIVFPKQAVVPDIVTAGLSTVAIRLPAHPVARALIDEAHVPIAAPSANPFNYISPTRAAHVAAQLGGRVDMILDGGDCMVGVESTIVECAGPGTRILRHGGLPLEEIERVIGPLRDATVHRDAPIAPGQLPAHYSPRTRLAIVRDAHHPPAVSDAALLAFRTPPRSLRYAAVEVLSPSGDLREAAANLFSALHRLDEAGVAIIYAEAVPEEGLGRAIMDRLRRAAAK